MDRVGIRLLRRLIPSELACCIDDLFIARLTGSALPALILRSLVGKFHSPLGSVVNSCIMIDVAKLSALKEAAIHENWAAVMHLCRELADQTKGSSERFLVGLLPPAVRRQDTPRLTGLVDELLKAAANES